MPMLLAIQKSGSRVTALKSNDRFNNKTLLPTPFYFTAILSIWSINRSYRFTHLWHRFNTFWDVSWVSTIPSVQTIKVPLEHFRDGGNMLQNRFSFPLVLFLIVLLANFFPTTTAAGLGLTRQQHRLQPSPFFDLERSNVESVPPVDDSTIKIRTRENPTAAFQQPQIGSPAVDPFVYSVPPVDSDPQRTGFVPVLVPNSYYYSIYGSPWGYPETRLVGTYSQYNPVSRRISQSNRRKPMNKRRREKYKSEKCPKICDTCIRIQDNRDIDQERERDELQRRFAIHVRPSLQHRDSVEALFKYMDGNNDGSVSLTELQNYLLLHNIISLDIPQ